MAQQAVISVQVLNEFANVLRRKRAMALPDVETLCTTLIDTCDVVDLSVRTHQMALTLMARYNVSVAEVGDHDLHGRTQIGVAAVSTRGDHAQHQIEAVFRFIEETRPDVVWIDSDIELL